MFNINYSVFLIIASCIELGRSAMVLTAATAEFKRDYMQLKGASVHRGILFSLSPTERNELCQELFPKKLDETSGQRDKNHPVMVTTLKVFDEIIPFEEAFFECVGERFQKKTISRLAYAYVPNFFFMSVENKENKKFTDVKHYVVLSPEYVNYNQAELEDLYVNTRRNIKAINAESPEFVELIKKRDVFSNLSPWLKLSLCYSILSSPIYKEKGWRMALGWTTVNPEKTKDFEYKLKSLIFKKDEYADENWTDDCILCKALKRPATDEEVMEDREDFINLYFARSYNNENSVFVLEEENDGVVLNKYFRNIFVLTEAREYIGEEIMMDFYPEFERKEELLEEKSSPLKLLRDIFNL